MFFEKIVKNFKSNFCSSRIPSKILFHFTSGLQSNHVQNQVQFSAMMFFAIISLDWDICGCEADGTTSFAKFVTSIICNEIIYA